MKIVTSYSRLLCQSLAAASLLTASLLPAQQAAQPIVPAPADPAIAAALQQVSPQNIQATIEKLVSFKNRSTLSSMDTDLPPGTGVTAAADWIYSEFERYSQACGGCLEVKRDDSPRSWFLVAVIASVMWGRMVDRSGPKRTLVAVLISWAVGLTLGVISLSISGVPGLALFALTLAVNFIAAAIVLLAVLVFFFR